MYSEHPMRAPSVTQEIIANAAGVTRMAITKYEQYLYANLPSKLAHAYAICDPYGRPPVEFQDIYLKEKRDIQLAARSVCMPPPFIAINSDKSPFLRFREEINIRSGHDPGSRIAFCKTLAVHPHVVAEYEKRKSRERPMPPIIKDALKMAGLSEDYCLKLEMAQNGTV